MTFRAKTTLDKVFEVSILIKAAHGLLEIISGLALLFIKPEHVTHLATWLTRAELAEDPHDLIAGFIMHSVQGINHGVLLFAAAYLLSHGVIKVVLVWEILHDRLWAYPGLIIVTAGFVIYQVYELGRHPNIWLVGLTIFDLIIIYLTAREYALRRRDKQTPRRPKEPNGSFAPRVNEAEQKQR